MPVKESAGGSGIDTRLEPLDPTGRCDRDGLKSEATVLTTKHSFECSVLERDEMRALLTAAFGPSYDNAAWQNAQGGIHFLLRHSGVLVAHVSLIERTIEVDEQPVECFYVESMAALPAYQRVGFGTCVMAAASAHVRLAGRLGVLATAVPDFYRRLGWQRWRGETLALTAEGERRKEAPRGCLMLLSTEELKGVTSLAARERPGDVW